jgi:hypothetical protein
VDVGFFCCFFEGFFKHGEGDKLIGGKTGQKTPIGTFSHHSTTQGSLKLKKSRYEAKNHVFAYLPFFS